MATQPPYNQAQNDQARAIVLAMTQPMIQRIGTFSVDPANQNVLNIPPRNVGLITGFIVVVEGDVLNGAADLATRTGFGSANALQQITYTDLNGVQRIQTTGYHLAMLNSAKQGFAFGGAYAPNLPMAYGNNWTPFAAPATLAATDGGTVKHTYFVPLAYTADDLRGSVYANVLNATQNLQVAINTDPFVGATDPLSAIYSGNNLGGWDGNVTVTVYQCYLDQVPMVNKMPLLPMFDINTVYDLKNTVIPSLAVNQDNPFAYANQRRFQSTFAVFDNGGTFNSGSDVNYFRLLSANSTELWNLDPDTIALLARQIFMADTPPGVYYFDHRRKPIDTISFGNMTLNLNPKTVNANAQLILCTEAFQEVNQIPFASSLSVG
jgi:hypothetical protein